MNGGMGSALVNLEYTAAAKIDPRKNGELRVFHVCNTRMRRLSCLSAPHPSCPSDDDRMTPRNWVAIEDYVSNVVKKQFRSALLSDHQGSMKSRHARQLSENG